jgi:hypothetical protein
MRFRLGIVVAAGLAVVGPASATPEYSRRTGKECNVCHPANTFRLNDAGRYYKEHKSLKGFVPPPDPAKQGKPAPAKPAGPAPK